MNLLTLLLTTLSLLPTPSYTQESSSSSSSDDSSQSTSSFTVTAYRSDSPINNLPLTIFSGRFYLGGRTSSYCPPGVASEGECPPGNETIIVGGNGLVRPLTPTPYPPYPHPQKPPTNPTPLRGTLKRQSPSPAANKSTSSPRAPYHSQPRTHHTCLPAQLPAHSAIRRVLPTEAGIIRALLEDS